MDSDLLDTWLIPYQRNAKNIPSRPTWIQTISIRKAVNSFLVGTVIYVETKAAG
jgi:hypothetical protein